VQFVSFVVGVVCRCYVWQLD